MNSEAATLLRKRHLDLQSADHQQRRQILSSLKLRTVLKESHCSHIHALSFNSLDEDCANLFTTVGRDQVTVYDDMHMGDYVAIVVQYVNNETDHAQGGELRACTWLETRTWTQHAQGDACLAVAGADTDISVISIVEAQVILQLKGHQKEIVELASCRAQPELLASLAKDGELRVWHVPSELCLARASTDALSLAMRPDGLAAVTGGKRNILQLWDLSALTEARRSAVKSGKKLPQAFPVELHAQVMRSEGDSSHLEPIDCLQYLDGTRLAAKSSDGRLIVTDTHTQRQIASWKVPGCQASNALDARCRFGVSADGTILCAGNSSGQVYIFDTASGSRLAHLAAIKMARTYATCIDKYRCLQLLGSPTAHCTTLTSHILGISPARFPEFPCSCMEVSGPVRACGISQDCRHLLAAMGNGFIFRFEAVSEQDLCPEHAPETAEGAVMEE